MYFFSLLEKPEKGSVENWRRQEGWKNEQGEQGEKAFRWKMLLFSVAGRLEKKGEV